MQEQSSKDYYKLAQEQQLKEDHIMAKKIGWAILDLFAIFMGGGLLGAIFMTQTPNAAFMLGLLMFVGAYIAGTLREQWRWEKKMEEEYGS